MKLDRDVLEVILKANHISAERERAALEPKESPKEVAARLVVEALIKRVCHDLNMVKTMLVEGGYIPDNKISLFYQHSDEMQTCTAVTYLNDRGQYIKVFPYEFMARRVATDLGIAGQDQPRKLADYVTGILEKMGIFYLKAKVRYGNLNAYIVTT